MALYDAQRLFDILLRLQVFVEGVKAYQARQFSSVLNEVNIEFRKLLLRINYPTLDALTKSELNKLIVLLRNSQSKVYTVFTEKVLKQLEDFTKASLSVNRIIYASTLQMDEGEEIEFLSDEDADALILGENDENDFAAVFGIAAILKSDDGKTMWTKVNNEPIAANGALIKPFIKSFTASAQVNMENLLRKAYSNSWTPAQLATEADTHMGKVFSQNDAVQSTMLQHIESMVSTGIASALYGKYKWISVIDSGTTDICRSRDQKIYDYANGPLPPAHIRCRSMTMPYFAGWDLKETFYSWIGRQSASIQNIALGKITANLLRAGKLKAKDAIKLSDPMPISIDDFKNSAEEILAA